ncbi:MAG: hypothetical protein U0804_16045 [Gemmataceae bacterium]
MADDARTYLAHEALLAMRQLREAEWHRLREVYKAGVRGIVHDRPLTPADLAELSTAMTVVGMTGDDFRADVLSLALFETFGPRAAPVPPVRLT